MYGQEKYDEAVTFFKEAADGGNLRAMYNLGVMYEQGKLGGEPKIEKVGIPAISDCNFTFFGRRTCGSEKQRMVVTLAPNVISVIYTTTILRGKNSGKFLNLGRLTLRDIIT